MKSMYSSLGEGVSFVTFWCFLSCLMGTGTLALQNRLPCRGSHRFDYRTGASSSSSMVSLDIISSNILENEEVAFIASKEGGQLAPSERRITRPRSFTSSLTGKASNNLNIPLKKPKSGLLTKEEERMLVNEIRMSRTLVRIRKEVIASSSSANDVEQRRLSKSEWAKACGIPLHQLQQIILQGKEARCRMITANEGLVRSISRRYLTKLKRSNQEKGCIGTILSYHDLVQEGNLGLMEAIERFEPERGCRFSTYATWWIRQRIVKAITDHSRVIRLPAHVHETIRKIRKGRKAIKMEIGRQPSNSELAQYLGLNEEKVELYSDVSRTTLSLEHRIQRKGKSDKATTTLVDFISSDSPTPDEDAETQSLREEILSVVGELPNRERDVVVARFGLEDGTLKTVDETSQQLGLPPNRVRKVEARALRSLRQPKLNNKLKSYYYAEGNDRREEKYIVDGEKLTPEQIWSL